MKVSDGATVNVYSVYDGSLSNHGSMPNLTTGVTYFVMVSTPYSVDLQIKKRENAEDDGYVMDEKYDQTFNLNDMHRRNRFILYLNRLKQGIISSGQKVMYIHMLHFMKKIRILEMFILMRQIMSS